MLMMSLMPRTALTRTSSAILNGALDHAETLRRGDLQKARVRDGDQRIHALAQPGDADVGVLSASLALEAEGLGHDRDRESAELPGDLGDHRGAAGARAAAHAGGDEDHVRAREQVLDLVPVFERRVAADVRIGAGAEAAGQLLAHLDFVRSEREAQRSRLNIGIPRGDDEARPLRGRCGSWY